MTETNMKDDFQNIVKTVRPMLISLCRNFFDQQELAYDTEDAVQETLLRLWLLRDKLSEYHSHEALAVKIAKNVCIDILKQAGTQHSIIGEEIQAYASTQTDHQVIAHDTERIVNQALAKLPNTQRRMLIMRSEGMSMEQIAEACGTKPTSVKTMICAGRKQLMTTLNLRRKGK